MSCACRFQSFGQCRLGGDPLNSVYLLMRAYAAAREVAHRFPLLGCNSGESGGFSSVWLTLWAPLRTKGAVGVQKWQPMAHSYKAEMDPSDFLKQFMPGFADLSHNERTAIANFTLLWTAMEGRVVDANANPNSLLAAVREIARRRELPLGMFEASLAHFSERYIRDGELTYHFEHLHFRKPDRRPLVEAVLKGDDVEPENVVGALLLITYRLRNNLFHGEKWAYGMRDQEANFLQASEVLMRIIELHQA
jgi:hypothetical protein